MKFLHISNVLPRMENCHHQDSGDVRAAIYQRKHYLTTIPVGVQRRQTLDPFQDCLLTLVDRLARRADQVTAHILAIVSAMLGHVNHVLIWDRLLHASVGKRPPLDDAWIQIMSMVGPVARFVEMCFPAENIYVKSPATRDYAEVVMF